MTHRVGIEELEDFYFDRVLCSSHPKKLSVWVHPAENHLHFILSYDGLEIGRFNSLDVALFEYNNL